MKIVIKNCPSWVWYAILLPLAVFIVFISQAKGAEPPDNPPASTLAENTKPHAIAAVSVQDIVLQLPSGEFWVMPRGTKTIGVLDESLTQCVEHPKLLKNAYEHPGEKIPEGASEEPTYVRRGLWDIRKLCTTPKSVAYDMDSRKFCKTSAVSTDLSCGTSAVIIVFANLVGLTFLLIVTWKWRYYVNYDIAIPPWLINILLSQMCINMVYGLSVGSRTLCLMCICFTLFWLIKTFCIKYKLIGNKAWFVQLRWPTLALGVWIFCTVVFDGCTSW